MSSGQDRLNEIRAWFAKEKLAQDWLGAQLSYLAEGEARLVITAHQGLLITSEGIVQGGVSNVVALFAAGCAAMSVIPAGHTRVLNLNVSYRRPIKDGETIVVVAKVTDQMKNIFVEVVLTGAADNKKRAVVSIMFARPKP